MPPAATKIAGTALLAASIATMAPAAGASDFAPAAQPGIELELGAAGRVAPRYEGASDYLVTPVPLIRLKRLTLPNGFQIGGRPAGGLSLSPSFNVRGARRGVDVPPLAGLADVDRAFELGLEAAYEAEHFKLHASLRRGFGGHEGWTGEAGADLIVRPAPDVKAYAGPRLSYADGRYMDTYFSVPTGIAGLAAFDADGGIKSFGAEAGVRYQFNADWAIEGEATYDRLIGDAGASPVTAVGSRDQFAVRIGVVRKLRIDF